MSTNEELSNEIMALRTELLGQMEELKSIIRFAMGTPSVTPRQQIASLTDGSVLAVMTSKQHAAMQMWLFSGMNMADMARRMSCSRNTARLHLKALWTKMATDDKDVIVDACYLFLSQRLTLSIWSGVVACLRTGQLLMIREG